MDDALTDAANDIRKEVLHALVINVQAFATQQLPYTAVTKTPVRQRQFGQMRIAS